MTAGKLPAGRAEREVPRHLPERREAQPRLSGCARSTVSVRRPVSPRRRSRTSTAQFYARIFEVILRLKGNYLWPAMWNNAFAEDDPDNPRLADEYGIVMGTSHQEPMLRAQKEWDWHLQREHGNWNYATHPEVLTRFWREGSARPQDSSRASTPSACAARTIRRWSTGQAESIALLEKIVDVQRTMHRRGGQSRRHRRCRRSGRSTRKCRTTTRAGLRVPDDVTLLWAEDNWGNVRRLPTAEERTRAGGAGVYYHFDYHGGPRSYQWINTNPIAEDLGPDEPGEAVRRRSHLDRQRRPLQGLRVPDGVLPRTSPGTPTAGRNDNLNEYTRLWAEREFGALTPAMPRTSSRGTASSTAAQARAARTRIPTAWCNYREVRARRRGVQRARRQGADASTIGCRRTSAMRSTSWCLFPDEGLGAGERAVRRGRRRMRSTRSRAAPAPTTWRRARANCSRPISDLMTHFNKVFAGGKWDHFMDQPHIGYTTWRDPPANSLDAIRLVERSVPEAAGLGVAVDGSPQAWPGPPPMPVTAGLRFDQSGAPLRRRLQSRPRAVRRIGDRRATPGSWWTMRPRGSSATRACGSRSTGTRRRPAAATAASRSPAPARVVRVAVSAFKPEGVTRTTLARLRREPGLRFDRSRALHDRDDAGAGTWLTVEDYGHTAGGMRATAPVDAPAAEPGKDAPRLDYLHAPVHVRARSRLRLTLAPSLNFLPDRAGADRASRSTTKHRRS